MAEWGKGRGRGQGSALAALPLTARPVNRPIGESGEDMNEASEGRMDQTTGRDVKRERWCILRTGGAQTLRLVRTLNAAGFEAWSPVRTIGVPETKRAPRSERDLPILPTFVFARAGQLSALAHAAVQAVSPHPGFSIFRHGGRIPLIGDAAIDGLRAEEAAEASRIQAERDDLTREERRKARVAVLTTERARKKALRAERRDFDIGAPVTVGDMPALMGMTGIVERSDGRSALVSFGGMLEITVEAWRLSPHDVGDAC